MPHQRQLIREAAVALLKGHTSAGTRVFETRVTPYKEVDLPAISVFALQESVDPASRDSAPRELTRSLQLAVEGVVQLSKDVDDELDGLALQIERALHADSTLAGSASDALLSSTEIDVAEQGGRPIGYVRLTYAVTYYTHAPEAADVPLDDFKTADVRHSLGGTQAAADQAHDVLNLEV